MPEFYIVTQNGASESMNFFNGKYQTTNEQ